MRNYLIIAMIVSGCFLNLLPGQTNLIRNHSFEDGNPNYPTNTGQLDKTRRWKRFRDGGATFDGTSDWFENSGAFRGGVNCDCGGPVTLNQAPYPPPNDGTHFAGIIREVPNQDGEGIQQRFRRKLSTGFYDLDLDYLLPCDTKSYALKVYFGKRRHQLDYLAKTQTLPAQDVGQWQNLTIRIYVPTTFHRKFDWIIILNDGDPQPNVNGQTGSYIYLDDIHLFETRCDACTPSGLISWNQNIPQHFSPNGDNVADSLFVENINNAIYYEWEIFDRWGNSVYKTDGFDPNGFENHRITWDGRDQRNGNLLLNSPTVQSVLTLGNCDTRNRILTSVFYCFNTSCAFDPHDTVPSYVPPLFGLEPPPTHHRNLYLYGGPYFGRHHWYACDTIFVGGAGSVRTPYFWAAGGSKLTFSAGDAVVIPLGDSVRIDPGADVTFLPEPVTCCAALRIGNADSLKTKGKPPAADGLLPRK